jgi:uncharacterized protein (DUF433 family)
MQLVRTGDFPVNKYEERIIRNPKICGGVFKGTRVTLRTVLASLAAGDSPGRTLADFPVLQPEGSGSNIFCGNIRG